MKASHILMAAVLALGVLGGAAHAGIETTFVHVNTVEIDSTSYNVYDMMVAPTVDWTNSKLEIALTSGKFYNNADFGRDAQPAAAVIGLIPDLEWDTYAASPAGEVLLASFTPGSQFGQNPTPSDPQAPRPPMGNTVIWAGWFDNVTTGPGTFKVARLTLSSNAAGTIGGRSFNANPGSELPDIGSFDGMYTIIGGHIVPEPATLSLLAMGALAVMRRRRRRTAEGGGPVPTRTEGKLRMKAFVTSVILLGVLGGAAHAGIETTFVHVNTVEIDGTGYNVYDMMVAPTVDWTNSKLEITLTTGKFYNNPVIGSDIEAAPALFVFFPGLEWDTYAATPAGSLVPAAMTPHSQFGQTAVGPPIHPLLPPGNTQIEAGWFDTGIMGPGTFRVARLTLSGNAAGTIGGESYNANPGFERPEIVSFDGMYTIIGGHIVPEPATLTLLALGALAVMRRRRRSRSLALAQGHTGQVPNRLGSTPTFSERELS